MFPTAIRHVAAVSLLGAGVLLLGCQSTSRPATATAPTTQPASCPKCQNVWQTTPMANGHGTVTRTRVMQCQDCTNAVTNFLQTGQFKHVCTTCGDQVDQMCFRH